MRYKSFLIFLILSLCGSVLFAQEKYNFSRYVDETTEFIFEPLKWNGKDYLAFGVVTAGTILLMRADKSARDEALKDRSYYNSFAIEGGRIWGEWYTFSVIFGAFAFDGLINKNNNSLKIGFELIQATAYSFTITGGLKLCIGRARPYLNEGADMYKPFNSNEDYMSLPSGHVTSAFTISTVLSRNIRSRFWKAAVYVPAFFTAVSRVYQDQHWASDCFLGAAIGYVCGNWVVDRHDKIMSPVKIVSIYPLAVNWEF